MDSPYELMRLAPVIAVIENWAVGYLSECLMMKTSWGGYPGTALPPTELAYYRERNREPTDDLGFELPDTYLTQAEFDSRPRESCFEHVQKLLCHPDILAVEEGGLGDMREAIQILKESDDPKLLLEAAEVYVDASFEFEEHFIHTLPERLLGDWGARFYRLILDLDRKVTADFSRAFGTKVTDDPEPTSLLPEIDDKTFSVRVGSQAPCFLGNSKQFRLLEYLLGHPNRFFSFSELAEIAGGDSFDVDALKTVKCRLCKCLQRGGYRDLADMIVSQPGHYAYQPSAV
jgi:hypothetical protein